ncbi:NAD-dependent epimerase/dehydratase family protein [Haloferax sp. YSMS24]|uniref:NAD-dependent epimerase/dehydratase family protein n=1 Tax=Haloferax sp. YSMS24 TaxID=3388425 RepID=UPI00398CD6A0
MRVLITGAYGRCGTAIIDNLDDSEDYEFTYLNRSDRSSEDPYGGYDTQLADVADYDAMAPAFEGQDAVVHLAAHPDVDAPWPDILQSNIIGMYNALEAAREHGVETFVFASTNHVMGMYEEEFAPELYELGFDLTVDHTDPVRPDSYYGSSKSFGEDLGRYYVENFDAPTQFYSLRICSVRSSNYDHPYGDAEYGVENGEFERGSDAYERNVKRLKCTWQSRRDFAHQVEQCLRDTDVNYDIFYGVSDNDRRWFDIEHARDVIGYQPQDNAEDWERPPS